MGAASSSLPLGQKKSSKPLRPTRPNFNKLHAQPLPLNVYPLPPLIPNNPFSILYVAFSFAYQLFAPPISHPNILLHGVFSPETSSVHVADPDAIRVLWEKGFFGKGNLSRSEPSWLDRERSRRGIKVGQTSEEATKRRREERRDFKNERARKEREAIEEKLLEERAKKSHVPVLETEDTSRNIETQDDDPQTLLQGTIVMTDGESIKDAGSMAERPIPSITETRDVVRPEKPDLKVTNLSPIPSSLVSDDPTSHAIKQEEHLQLTPEEAFFLVYGLGVLDVRDRSSSKPLPPDLLFSLFRQHSYFPPCISADLQPDDPFLLSYVVYHHFRSLGWVVRPGIKFAVDHLLYKRGPVFSHAEFAVIILPSYSHSYWSSTVTLTKGSEKRSSKSWWWLHCVNRVQSQVQKNLIIVYVEVPPPSAISSIPYPQMDGKGQSKSYSQQIPTDIGHILKQYKVRELSIKRWTPNRSRD